MKPVMQTTFGDIGNCYSACIASMLELDISEVPNFAEKTSDAMGFWSMVRDYLESRNIELDFASWPVPPTQIHNYTNGVYIFSGKSPRSDRYHACVGLVQEGQYTQLHDPHPDGTGFKGEPVMIHRLLHKLDN